MSATAPATLFYTNSASRDSESGCERNQTSVKPELLQTYKMTPEPEYATRESKLAVLAHSLDGKMCEIKSGDTWQDCAGVSNVAQFIHWGYSARVKPTPKRVPLEAKDVPTVCWLRMPSENPHMITNRLIIAIKTDAVFFLDGSQVGGWAERSFKEIYSWEYSVDRVNWFPCSKEEK
jgi:hypothetical protein